MEHLTHRRQQLTRVHVMLGPLGWQGHSPAIFEPRALPDEAVRDAIEFADRTANDQRKVEVYLWAGNRAALQHAAPALDSADNSEAD